MNTKATRLSGLTVACARFSERRISGQVGEGSSKNANIDEAIGCFSCNGCSPLFLDGKFRSGKYLAFVFASNV